MKIWQTKYYLMIMLAVFLSSSFAHAFEKEVKKIKDFDFILENYKDKYWSQDEGPGAKKRDDNPNKAPSRYIYETPTVKALSHLYWAVNMYKVHDDDAVDEFMRINECEIYKNFQSDEVEWQDVRDATREFLRENKEEFPTRFEFILPLKLADYDEKRQAFKIQKKYQITSARRFELIASDFRTSLQCTRDHSIIHGYPRALVLEFSRPFNLVYVPVEKEAALDYIKRQRQYIKKTFSERVQSKALMQDLRNAYLVIKVKIFTYGKLLGLNNFELRMVQMMGVLEGYEIYEDINKEHLFYAQNYVTNQSRGKLDVILEPQYEILKEKAKGKGIFH